jgi:hypothetical protein
LHRLDDWSPDTEIELESHDDLFAKETWDVMGLSPRALLTLTTLTGAAAGGAVDAAVGFASVFAGTVLGGLGGLGVGVYELTRRFATASNVTEQAISAMKNPKDGYRVRVGPHPSLNFPFVLLARSLDHFDRVQAWAHAKKELPPPSESGAQISAALDTSTRRRLGKLFSKIQKKYRDVPRDTRTELRERLHRIVSESAKSLRIP